jgi:hypothetical protein
MKSLNSITFDTSSLDFEGEHDGALIWYTADDDGIRLFHFSIPPDIEVNLGSIDRVRDYYRTFVMNHGAAIVEVDVLQIAGCQSIRQIIKVPQQPAGMTYIGSITLPFRDFSYVVKMQCMEKGTTGVRDSSVLSEKMNAGQVTFNEETMKLQGWMQDPYDSSISYPLSSDGSICSYNISDSIQYDEYFPAHPLSRLRRRLDLIQKTLTVSQDVCSEPKFEYTKKD